MSDQNNYTAPVGTISMAITAPEFEGKTKRSDVQLLTNENHPAVLYAVVGLGTHTVSYNGIPKEQNKIFLGFEFPQLKQLFYEEDTVAKSTMLSIDSTFNMSDRSKLRAVAEAVIVRPFVNQTEADNFDVAKLVGVKLLVNVSTKNRKSDGRPYNFIKSLSPLGSYPLPANFNPELDLQLFAIDGSGNNFKTQNFANLPNWLKKQAMASHEGVQYAAKGGLFANKSNDTNTGATQQVQQQNQPQQTQQAAPQQHAQQPVQTKKFVMIDTQFTLEQWKKANWTEQQLVDGGKAKWEVSEPEAPQGPPVIPSAPAPQLPQGPPTAQAQQPAAEAQPHQASTNWTDETDEDDLPF